MNSKENQRMQEIDLITPTNCYSNVTLTIGTKKKYSLTTRPYSKLSTLFFHPPVSIPLQHIHIFVIFIIYDIPKCMALIVMFMKVITKLWPVSIERLYFPIAHNVIFGPLIVLWRHYAPIMQWWTNCPFDLVAYENLQAVIIIYLIPNIFISQEK